MKQPSVSTLALLVLLMAQLASSAADPRPLAQTKIDYVQDIQPLLQQHCWSCHGSEKQESGLRLDVRGAALLGGDSGKVIRPGDAAGSRLIELVSAVDPDELMPPEGEPLSHEQIDMLRAWIDGGAKWPDSSLQESGLNSHWAYQPLHRSALPETNDHGWAINGIDHFIFAKLEERGLQPSPEAERTTLIRRLSLDLLGLLPSIAETESFLNDDRPNAYELLVDRLLNSPHFGERWGRHWLDMARYADSDGYEKDNPRPDAYRWRDWVIDAINSDMPFDQFTIEQLAGDLLPNATDMQKLATAFHRQTLTNTEGGADQEQFRVEACFDRTETTGAVWLGLTVGCARCHTHKYDAITQREYYQLFAFYNNGDEATHAVPKSLAEVAAYQEFKGVHQSKVDSLKAKLLEKQAELGPALSAWEEQAKQILERSSANPLVRESLIEAKASGDGSINFELQPDGSFLVTGENPETAIYSIVGKIPASEFNTIRLDVLADNSLPAKGPGRVAHGNFVLSDLTAEVSETEDFAHSIRLKFDSAKADHEQAGRPWLAKDAIDEDEKSDWAIGSEYGQDHWAEFSLSEPLQPSKASFIRIRLSQQYGKQHTLGRFKLSLQSGMEPELKIPASIAKVLAIAAEDRNEGQRKELLEHFSRIDKSTSELIQQLDDLMKKEPAKPELQARVIVQREQDQRRTFVLRRGEFLEPMVEAEIVPAGFATLPPLTSRQPQASRPDRLDLAQWLVSPDNPLTPRVTVNHVWRHLFGRGIVKTANDFGVRGDPPTHPELLDWLATEFIDAGDTGNPAWSRKELIKLMVMSATYRQSSKQSEAMLASDPQNQFLGRQNRLRVEAEVVGDISLQVSGLLVHKIGGPSVFPALPPGVAELSYAGNFKWNESKAGDQYRRAMYTFFKRTSPHPNLITFDCPDANLTCVERSKSNTPLQALIGLNNASFADASRAFARRVMALPEIEDEASRLAAAFQMCLARKPNAGELQELTGLWLATRDWYADHPLEAQKLIGAFAVEGSPSENNAAWIATARIMINLDEFITRE